MNKAKTIADRLADEWLEMQSAIGWVSNATTIRRRSPYPCGETTSLPTEVGLMDVSESYAWASVPNGDIRLTVEVYWNDLDEPLACRETLIRRM